MKNFEITTAAGTTIVRGVAHRADSDGNLEIRSGSRVTATWARGAWISCVELESVGSEV